MSDIIHLLPDSIANQIAAGEVIQRPASVVKELVENSVDAGASHIRVDIKDAGRTLIRVIDNGKGMSAADARMAFERHATSKIKSAEDLFSLYTMGFRGEALASVAAVAHVELRTRQKGEDLGTRLAIAGSDLEDIEPDACAEGSNFSVKNLFFNIPARRKFLKKNDTEFRHIVNEFERIVLANPGIAFSLYHNDIEILNLPVSGLRQRIINVYVKGLNEKLLSVNAESAMATVSGFIGRPDASKKRGALQFFFVNGRYMRHPYFHKAVMQAYDQLIPVGEMPDYFIYFTIDPASIDVNIHPTKTEIKFENEQPVWQILLAAVRESLAKSSAIPTIDFDREDAIEIPVYNGNNTCVKMPEIQVDPAYNPFKTTPPASSAFRRPEFDWGELDKHFRQESGTGLPDTEDIHPVEISAATDGVSSSGRLPAGAITPPYQYKERYLITTLKSGLAVIDQHRAHIRILFDRYAANIRNRQGVSQRLLFPEIAAFTPAEASMIPSFIEDLHYVGFELNDLGQGSYAISGLPAGVEQLNPVSVVKDAVSHAIETGLRVKEEICCALAMSLAKAAAIRPGKALSEDEIEHLLASLFSSPDPYLAPDGKTIMTILTDEELEKRFR